MPYTIHVPQARAAILAKNALDIRTIAGDACAASILNKSRSAVHECEAKLITSNETPVQQYTP